MDFKPTTAFLKNLLQKRKEIVNKVYQKTQNSARVIYVPGYLSNQIQLKYKNTTVSKWNLVIMGFPMKSNCVKIIDENRAIVSIDLQTQYISEILPNIEKNINANNNNNDNNTNNDNNNNNTVDQKKTFGDKTYGTNETVEIPFDIRSNMIIQIFTKGFPQEIKEATKFKIFQIELSRSVTKYLNDKEYINLNWTLNGFEDVKDDEIWDELQKSPIISKIKSKDDLFSPNELNRVKMDYLNLNSFIECEVETEKDLEILEKQHYVIKLGKLNKHFLFDELIGEKKSVEMGVNDISVNIFTDSSDKSHPWGYYMVCNIAFTLASQKEKSNELNMVSFTTTLWNQVINKYGISNPHIFKVVGKKFIENVPATIWFSVNKRRTLLDTSNLTNTKNQINLNCIGSNVNLPVGILDTCIRIPDNFKGIISEFLILNFGSNQTNLEQNQKKKYNEFMVKSDKEVKGKTIINLCENEFDFPTQVNSYTFFILTEFEKEKFFDIIFQGLSHGDTSSVKDEEKKDMVWSSMLSYLKKKNELEKKITFGNSNNVKSVNSVFDFLEFIKHEANGKTEYKCETVLFAIENSNLKFYEDTHKNMEETLKEKKEKVDNLIKSHNFDDLDDDLLEELDQLNKQQEEEEQQQQKDMESEEYNEISNDDGGITDEGSTEEGKYDDNSKNNFNNNINNYNQSKTKSKSKNVMSKSNKSSKRKNKNNLEPNPKRRLSSRTSTLKT